MRTVATQDEENNDDPFFTAAMVIYTRLLPGMLYFVGVQYPYAVEVVGLGIGVVRSSWVVCFVMRFTQVTRVVFSPRGVISRLTE